MPAPDYLGDTSWQRQPGATVGITDGGVVWYEIPYRGRENQSTAFRNAWEKGNACPILSFAHLKLVGAPTITDAEGGAATSMLRFEGVDINGDFGQEVDTEEYYDESKSLTIQTSPSDESKAVFRYNAPVAIINYSADSRRSDTKSAPTLTAPEPAFLESFETGASFLSAAEIAAEHKSNPVWITKAISGFTRITKQTDDVWMHEEFHTIILEPIPINTRLGLA